MAKTDTNDKTVKQSEVPTEHALGGIAAFLTAKRVETIVAILLGITTLLSAWAGWIAHLHGGLQSINFTESNNTASHSSSEYNLGMQAYLADYMTWNNLVDYNYQLEAAKTAGNKTEEKLITERIEKLKKQGISENLAKAIKWMEENNADNPFMMPGMDKLYFSEAEQTVNQSQEHLEEGKFDNKKGDSYQLVTVIYSLTLFLLGIVGTFKSMPNRIVVLAIAVSCLVGAFIYMCTIPLPTGFENMNFFDFGK